jgi:16S rRNA (guanine527-N7)-methyltransferase
LLKNRPAHFKDLVMDNCRKILIDGLTILNINYDEIQIALVLKFLNLIEKWNKAYNLTAIREREEMARLHILDSLAILPHLHGQRLIDIGTGAGLPGIPLAIFRPEMEFVLLDSNAKKTRFVQQAVLELGLKNVTVINSRVEDYQPLQRFDSVTCRAFAGIRDILQLTAHLLAEDGMLLAMKGQQPLEQLTDLNHACRIIPLAVPQVEAERCLVCISAQPNEVNI